jgi:HEPN domain-containing protein
MPHDSARADSPERWIDYARADLAFAGAPLPPGGFYEQLCFHAQQAVEKSIKAVLLHLRIDFPFTHDIHALVDLLPKEIPRTLELVEAVELSPYAVLARYPGETEPVVEDEWREALKVAEAVVAWAGSLLRGR